MKVNGVDYNEDYYKDKTEDDFVAQEKHHFENDESKAREGWALLQEALAAKAKEKKN